MPPSLFIGVVSHDASRFRFNQGPSGLAAQVSELMPDALVHVNTLNLLDPTTRIDPKDPSESFRAQMAAERAWGRFIGADRSPRWWMSHLLHNIRHRFHSKTFRDEGGVRRLLNIELSHRDLIRRGLESGADWLLIVEDDASTDDVEDLVAGLRGIMGTQTPPQYVNLSESFSLKVLGVEHLLHSMDVRWAGTSSRRILGAEKPITNTVCAMLYRSEFARSLIAALNNMPLTPVLPIDWKINVALMMGRQTGILNVTECWVVAPAPIEQLSMSDSAILTP